MLEDYFMKSHLKMASVVEKVKAVMDRVYGPFSSNWKPKSFAENKSRYLWTDAFGVVNYLTLFAETGDDKYLSQAKTLVSTVHDTLGKTRDLSKRLGNSTDNNPLLGGLRIGKPEAEGPSMSEDGQYYHYLTKWMFALNRMTAATKEPHFNSWAIDLAKAVHPHFVQNVNGKLRMFWKMSIDLSHPLVMSEGGLDPYDGYVTYRLLQESSQDGQILVKEIDDMRTMVEAKYRNYRTNDSLDAGEALWLAHFFPDEEWAKHLHTKAGDAVELLWRNGEFDGNYKRRLAFREFGTTTGVQMHPDLQKHWAERCAQLHSFWMEHLFIRDDDITPVMYCTSLLPGYFAKNYGQKN